MRTVVENRYGVDREPERQDTGYVHLGQRPSQSKSCFYDFGERKRVRFIESADSCGSKFIESLIEQFCS